MKYKIRRNENYTQKTISGQHYLIPFGQMIADFKKGLRLNDTGKWLFGILKTPMTREEIVHAAADYYEVSTEDKPQLAEDIGGFIDSLIRTGILIEDDSIQRTIEGGREIYARIAGINVRFSCPQRLFPAEFSPFVIEKPAKTRLNIAISDQPPRYTPRGSLIIRYEELEVVRADDRYVLYFPRAKGVVEAHMSLRSASCIYYVTGDRSQEALYDLFRSIRIPALFNARMDGKVAVHSSSILYRGRAWLFSAPSGTGKSYHTFMWNKFYDVPLINGDTSITGRNPDGKILTYGSPWCGTSNICSPDQHPLGGIILLARGREDHVEELSEADKRMLVLRRLITPAWDENSILKNIKIVDDMMKDILVCRLHCTMDRRAVDVIKKHIDRYLS